MISREIEASNVLVDQLSQQLEVQMSQDKSQRNFRVANLHFEAIRQRLNGLDSGSKEMIELADKLSASFERHQVELLCITMAARDEEVERAAKGKEMAFHKKGLALIEAESDKLTEGLQANWLGRLATRLTLVGHWAPRDGVGAYSETTQACRSLSEACGKLSQYPRLQRFTILGCSSAIPPSTISEDLEERPSEETQSLIKAYDAGILPKAKMKELETLLPRLKGITLFQPQDFSDKPMSLAEKKARMLRFMKRGFHEEDRFDLLHARLAERALITINQNRPLDKKVTVKGYATDITPCGKGKDFYIRAEKVEGLRAKSVSYAVPR